MENFKIKIIDLLAWAKIKSIITIVLFVFVYTFVTITSYINRISNPEYIRANIINQASADLSVTLNTRTELEAKLQSVIADQIYIEAIIKWNSQTWIVKSIDSFYKINSNTIRINFNIVSTWSTLTGFINSWVATGAISPVPSIKKIIPKRVFKDWWGYTSFWETKPRSELYGSSFEEITLNAKVPVEYWIRAEKDFKIKKELGLCISRADTTIWRHTKTKNNIGNVGNNDRWNKVSFPTLESWVRAIFKTLNNDLLWHKQSVWSLSPWGWGDPSYYATSLERWNNNVLNCMSVVLRQTIDENFIFRIK